MLRFLHAADFHLDSAFSAPDARQAASRRQERRELAFRMADYIRENQIRLVLLAGDLFDNTPPYRESVEELARALEHTRARVFISPGNHDWYGPGSPWSTYSWPENVTIFSKNIMTAVPIPEWNLVIYGAAFTGPEQTRGLLKNFSVPRDETPGSKIKTRHIALLHGELRGGESRYNPVSPEDVSFSGLDYLALGHIHQRGEPVRFGRTLCAWPGCPEGRGFDESGEKGFYTGVFNNNGGLSLEFIPFAKRRYESLAIDVTDRDPAEAIASVLPPDTRQDLYRILLTGETEAGGVDTAALREIFAERFYSLELRDYTRLREDLWAGSGENSLRGLFLRELKSKWEAAQTERDRQIITQAARLGLAALDRRDLG